MSETSEQDWVVANLCDDAANYIDTHGWIQGDYKDLTGAVCTLGAMKAVAGDIGDLVEPVVSAHRAVSKHLGFAGGLHVADWNDETGRTVDEVVQVLRDVATKHRPDAMRSTPDGDAS